MSLNQELDFRLEADNTRLIGRQIADFPKLCTPTVYSGVHLAARADAELHERPPPGRRAARASSRHADTQAIARDLLSAYMKQIAIDGVFHCDPHPGNILLDRRRPTGADGLRHGRPLRRWPEGQDDPVPAGVFGAPRRARRRHLPGHDRAARAGSISTASPRTSAAWSAATTT